MADITMCTNKQCKDKDKCYRQTAWPNSVQSYSLFRSTYNGKCEFFIKSDNRCTG